MTMESLKTCCNRPRCCCRLRTGTLILGSISLTISTIVLIILIHLISSDDYYKEYSLWEIMPMNTTLAKRLCFTLSFMTVSITLLFLASMELSNYYILPCFISLPGGVALFSSIIIFVWEEIQESEDMEPRHWIFFLIFNTSFFHIIYKAGMLVYEDYRLIRKSKSNLLLQVG